MRKKNVNIFQLLVVVCSIGAAFSQDFEPEPLQPPVRKTTTPTIETTTTTPIIETTTTTPVVETTTTTPIIETTTTTPITEITTTSTPESISTTTESETTIKFTTDRPMISTTTVKTPSPTEFPASTLRPHPEKLPQCYYRRQRGQLLLHWTCNGPIWLYDVICYQCCVYSNSNFAGCGQVHPSYCNRNYS